MLCLTKVHESYVYALIFHSRKEQPVNKVNAPRKVTWYHTDATKVYDFDIIRVFNGKSDSFIHFFVSCEDGHLAFYGLPVIKDEVAKLVPIRYLKIDGSLLTLVRTEYSNNELMVCASSHSFYIHVWSNFE